LSTPCDSSWERGRKRGGSEGKEEKGMRASFGDNRREGRWKEKKEKREAENSTEERRPKVQEKWAKGRKGREKRKFVAEGMGRAGGEKKKS
jgi:hypothetical protein